MSTEGVSGEQVTLISNYGATGAALSTLAGVLISNLLMLLFLYRKYGLAPRDILLKRAFLGVEGKDSDRESN
ncbi:MAG: hypothetical protein CMM46_03460 [Rhodospirillaceae bacterium]|nr:hypothetical protein [Rhodospirillaceae bacterium]